MPQLQFETYASQIFWLLVCLLTLIGVSTRYTLPKLAVVLKKRWNLIEGTRLEADRLKKDADLMADRVEADLNDARRKSHEEILRATRDMTQKLSVEKQQLARKSKDRFKSEELRLYQKKAAAMGDIQVIAESITSELVQKILKDYTHVAIEEVVAETLRKKAVNDV